MSKPRRANRDLIKAMNRNLILNLVRREGAVSRTQITDMSGLSMGAVSQITNDLLEEGWFLAAGESDYTGGRRQEMLRLNPNAGRVIGLKLMEDRLVCAVTDLESKVLHYLERELTYDHTAQAVSQALSRTIQEAIHESRVKRKDVLGVGIGLAGIVDYPSGVVDYSPYFHWRRVPLTEMIRQQLGLPVYLENDVNTLTVAEQLFGHGQHVSNFVVVTVGRGIGMGMSLNHQLYQGARGAGEIGHIYVTEAPVRCDCGNTGCLEAVAADPAVLQHLQQQGYHEFSAIDQVAAAAQQGHQAAKAALNRSGYYLGVGLSTVVNLIHPALIVISGEGVIAGNERLQPMRAALEKHCFNGLLHDVELVIKPTDDQMWARGAASIVVGRVFASPLASAEVN